MSTHNICFCEEIRKNINTIGLKKKKPTKPILSRAEYFPVYEQCDTRTRSVRAPDRGCTQKIIFLISQRKCML